MTQETIETIYHRMKETYCQESGMPLLEGSDTDLRFLAVSAQLWNLHHGLAALQSQTSAETATGEHLDRHGTLWGIPRMEGQKARGTVTFSIPEPLSFHIQIAEGTVCCQRERPYLRYTLEQGGILRRGQTSVTLEAVAEQEGDQYNAEAGSVNQLVSPIAGIETVDSSAMTGGCTQEEDDGYRQRILTQAGRVVTGVSLESYEAAAMAVAGVFYAKATKTEEGRVLLYVLGQRTPLEDAICQKVTQAVETIRPLGVTVRVETATEEAVHLTMQLRPKEGVDFADCTALCTEAVESYFATLGLGQPLCRSTLLQKILNTNVVERFTLGTLADVTPEPSKRLVPGMVTFLPFSQEVT